MLVAAVLFILGIVAHPLAAGAPAAMLAAAGALLATALILRCRALPSTMSLALAFGCLGLAAGAIESRRFADDHIALFTSDAPGLARIEARIVDVPRLLTAPVGGRPLPPRQVTRAQVTGVLTADGWRRASGLITVSIGQPHPELDIAQTVQLFGQLQRPRPPENPGQLDWADYYRQQRILAAFSAPQAQNVALVRSESPSLLERARAAARRWTTPCWRPWCWGIPTRSCATCRTSSCARARSITWRSRECTSPW
jgi:hypothetical protein